jgi:hypothetical protein
MPYPVKPASKPNWTDSNPGVRQEPSGGYKNTGWFSNLRPPFQFMNWLFYNIGTEWLNYFEAATDFLKAAARPYDFSIGTGGDFADINAAIASSSVQPGARLVILNSLALANTQQVTKNNLEFVMGPGVVLSDGGAGTLIQVSATRCRFKGGKIAGATVQGFLIDAGSNYTMIGEMAFATNAADITDNNNKTASWGIINE